ncbi:hypothetical protein HYH03_006137 [Edaphochlamys debaryana]|uniref:Uncharacterized protein n=1 Tax=Edaphochlamys debaryana TaxID=47281 RepID=A0A835Y671_9CHLO|nr:hypothetical protein HYH03_006137 [Edaphochlamys debaryana]|eukprot:KAG2495899.1 hypothetical protein HYH03_006137 [Edaphochlamys debaryana]
MRPKDRLGLAAEDAHTYNKLYASTQGTDVWNRLVSDATVRQSMSRTVPPHQDGQAQIRYSYKNSGFDSNTNPAVYTHNTFKAGHYEYGVPIEAQHPITAARFKAKHPMEFMQQIRPDTETTSQSLRMLGTYEADFSHADRMGIFIPHMCPGGKPAYHPDVTTGGFGMSPTLPRRGLGDSLQDGRNLK